MHGTIRLTNMFSLNLFMNISIIYPRNNYPLKLKTSRINGSVSSVSNNHEDVSPMPDSNSYDKVSISRILGGSEVDIKSFPFAVSYGIHCCGAVLRPSWVITAAHCKEEKYLRAGSNYATRGPQHEIAQYFHHPMWAQENKSHKYDYDFQLLKLLVPLVYSDHIRSVEIGFSHDVVTGKMVTVLGWGRISQGGVFATKLRTITVPIVSFDLCQAVPYENFYNMLTPRMFCAGYGNANIDACQGDSGGPVVIDNRLVGMVSFGYGCGVPGTYGVYSKIGEARKWILDTIQ